MGVRRPGHRVRVKQDPFLRTVRHRERRHRAAGVGTKEEDPPTGAGYTGIARPRTGPKLPQSVVQRVALGQRREDVGGMRPLLIEPAGELGRLLLHPAIWIIDGDPEHRLADDLDPSR
jgi:hypothetical protein